MEQCIMRFLKTSLTALFLQLFITIDLFAANGAGGPSHPLGGGTTGAHAQQGGSFQSLIFLVIIIVLFYFVLIRPQMKQSKAQKQMLNSIKPGDEVLTTAGIVGKIKNMNETFIDLEIASDVTIKIQKQALSKVMPKGSLKN
jgi:preprotein translocase subunit YajC